MGEFPWDDEDTLCPICGAYSPRQCEMLDEGAGECLWEMLREEPPAPSRREEG